MSSERATVFLQNVLSQHKETERFPYADKKELERSLVDLSEKNQALFFCICKELTYSIIEHLNNMPAPDLPKGTLETIVKDLTTIIQPLWILRRYGQLEDYVVKARDSASSASKMTSIVRRNSPIQACNKALKKAFEYLKGMPNSCT